MEELLSNLSTHDEPDEEGGDGHPQNQQLPAVAPPEGVRVHVHHRCH